MDENNVIEVRNVSKYFKIYEDKSNMLRERIAHHGRNKYQKHLVLDNISFDVKKGETVGLIGKNGCGKSTTLKMLTKILRPNSGTIETKGKVYSMIELGAGFHPDMSGRENVYINASIYGITHKEVDERIDDIIKFSELEDFIDNPVRTYSSGMYLRLAFSVAISVDADILLVDEILAVGDQAFQAKCMRKLKELEESGITIVLVSHSLGQIQEFCKRAIWIENGHIKEDGPSQKVCEDYKLSSEIAAKKRQIDEIMEDKKNGEDFTEIRKIIPQADPSVEHGGVHEISYTHIQLTDNNGNPKLQFRIGEPMILDLEYRSDNLSVITNQTVDIIRSDWQYAYGTNMESAIGQKITARQNSTVKTQLKIKGIRLLPGTYHFNIHLYNKDNIAEDYFNNCIEFKILSDKNDTNDELGFFTMPHKWII